MRLIQSSVSELQLPFESEHTSGACTTFFVKPGLHGWMDLDSIMRIISWELMLGVASIAGAHAPLAQCQCQRQQLDGDLPDNAADGADGVHAQPLLVH